MYKLILLALGLCVCSATSCVDEEDLEPRISFEDTNGLPFESRVLEVPLNSLFELVIKIEGESELGNIRHNISVNNDNGDSQFTFGPYLEDDEFTVDSKTIETAVFFDDDWFNVGDQVGISVEVRDRSDRSGYQSLIIILEE